MTIWLITSIRLAKSESFRASTIQNLQTACELAALGHTVVVWVAGLEPGGAKIIVERLGRELPAGLALLPYRARGPRDEKKTPFFRPLDRLTNALRARRLAPWPDVVISRSPRALEQLRQSGLLSGRGLSGRLLGGGKPGPKLILEYQYPEWALLWREWRRRNAGARPGECVARLRAWRRAEDARLAAADGILYAARGHEPLLARAGWHGPSRWLPSGGLPPEAEPAEEAMRNAEREERRADREAWEEGERRIYGNAELNNYASDGGPVVGWFDLGYVGSLAPENGLEGLLEAMALLASRPAADVNERALDLSPEAEQTPTAHSQSAIFASMDARSLQLKNPKSENPNPNLLLLGGGRAEYVAALRRRAEELGLAGRVIFAGRAPFREVRGWLRRCRVGIVPISSRQGPEKRQYASPLKLIEWMAAGVPVVAAAVPSIRQQAEDGCNALLVPPEDSPALAAALARLLGDRVLRLRLARAGLATAERVAWPRRAARIASFIEELRQA